MEDKECLRKSSKVADFLKNLNKKEETKEEKKV